MSGIDRAPDRAEEGGLAARRCVPCRGGIPPLTAEAAERYRVDTPAWRLADDARRLVRRFSFKDYRGALAFVAEISVVAEAEHHHPDVRFGWGYCEVSIQTHAIGGLHLNDFILAAKIDALAD